MFRAAENGHAETARVLLEKGAAVDTRKQEVAAAFFWLKLLSVLSSVTL